MSKYRSLFEVLDLGVAAPGENCVFHSQRELSGRVSAHSAVVELVLAEELRDALHGHVRLNSDEDLISISIFYPQRD